MMTIIAGTIGVACACFCWVFLHRREEKRRLHMRTAGPLGTLAFPYPIGSIMPSDAASRKSVITLDDAQHDKLANELFVAGYRTTSAVRFFRVMTHLAWALPVALTIYSFLTGMPDLIYLGRLLIAGVSLFLAVRWTLRLLKSKRQGRILKQMPQFIDLMIVCLEAGLNFTAALPRVIKEMDGREPLIKEFDLMHREYLSGLPFVEALNRLSKRCEVPDLAVVLNAIAQSEQMGTSLGNTLRIQAAQLRDKHRQRLREKAQQIEVKIAFPALLILSTMFIVTLVPSLYQISLQFSKIGFLKS